MPQTFGLELIETALCSTPDLFFRHPEFSFLLKEKVCALVIKLFSPSIKNTDAGQKGGKKLLFPVVIRLLRITRALVTKFHALLSTECEIFMSMLVRFLDADKPAWQRAGALEVMHTLSASPELLDSFSQYYDMHPSSNKIVRDLVAAITSYIERSFQTGLAGPSAPSPLGNGKP